MENSKPRPTLKITTITHRCRAKRRFTVVDDQDLVSLMRSVGRPLQGASRMETVTGAPAEGIYALPTNNVLEIYSANDGRITGYLFNNLDVWMTFVL
jgi:hypothetical protein